MLLGLVSCLGPQAFSVVQSEYCKRELVSQMDPAEQEDAVETLLASITMAGGTLVLQQLLCLLHLPAYACSQLQHHTRFCFSLASVSPSGLCHRPTPIPSPPGPPESSSTKIAYEEIHEDPSTLEPHNCTNHFQSWPGLVWPDQVILSLGRETVVVRACRSRS